MIDPQPAPPPSPALPTASSAELLGGSKELIIQHGQETYRLKLTANNKLILTK
jgi:hemin uptake protein HemP